MLHIIHDVKQSDYQSRCHHREFREDEKKFEKYKDAEKWLKKLSFKNTVKKKVLGLRLFCMLFLYISKRFIYEMC